MATDMDRACDDDDELVCRCDGCGGVLEPRDAESPVIYDCFHVLHAGCAHGRRDACPRCDTPRRVHDDDDDPPEPVDEARAPASPHTSPDEEDSALASHGMGNDDDRPGPGGGESPAPASVSGSAGCNHASRLGCCATCCSRRVAELERRLEEKSAALTKTTKALGVELVRARIRLGGLENLYEMLEDLLFRLRDGKRPREIDDAAMERKKPRNGGSSVVSQVSHRTRLTEPRCLFHGGLFSFTDRP